MLRHKLDFGQVAAAQMLSVVPLASGLGLGGGKSAVDAGHLADVDGFEAAVKAARASDPAMTGLTAPDLQAENRVRGMVRLAFTDGSRHSGGSPRRGYT